MNPAKHECDSLDLVDIFTKGISTTEELTHGTWIIPPPGRRMLILDSLDSVVYLL